MILAIIMMMPTNICLQTIYNLINFFHSQHAVLILLSLTILLMESQLANSPDLSDRPLLPLLDSLNMQLDHSFDDSQDDIDEDRCYLMQIEQLKRENNFLKKKIAELNKRHPVLGSMISKRKSLPAHIKPAQSIMFMPQQNYIVTFFEEVTRLLESFSQLFNVGAESNLTNDILKEQQTFNNLVLYNTDNLSRRLGRMLLQPQDKRYGELLNIFESYYVDNTEKEKSLKNKVEQLTSQAIELGKKMAENIRNREKLKASRIYSGFHEREFSKNCDELSILKSSNIKSTCTDSQLDLSGCKMLLGKDKMFENIF